MTTLYALIIEDTHTDVDVRLYATEKAAVDSALDTASQYAYNDADISIEDYEGYVTYIRYSPESSLCVVAREVLE